MTQPALSSPSFEKISLFMKDPQDKGDGLNLHSLIPITNWAESAYFICCILCQVFDNKS